MKEFYLFFVRTTPCERRSFDRSVELTEDTIYRSNGVPIKYREIALTNVITTLDRFLRPVGDSIVDAGELLGMWHAEQHEWEL